MLPAEGQLLRIFIGESDRHEGHPLYEWIVRRAREQGFRVPLPLVIKIAIDVCEGLYYAHHLTDPQIVQFLQWTERTTRRGWFVNDLHRKAVPYHLFRLWARFTNWHPFVKNDGAVSIRRSFIVEDWKRLCAAAGLDAKAVSIKEYRPARLCVGRIK